MGNILNVKLVLSFVFLLLVGFVNVAEARDPIVCGGSSTLTSVPLCPAGSIFVCPSQLRYCCASENGSLLAGCSELRAGCDTNLGECKPTIPNQLPTPAPVVPPPAPVVPPPTPTILAP